MTLKKAFITGNSSGLGYGITESLLSNDYHVYGCSRRGCNLSGHIDDVQCDLTDLSTIPMGLENLLGSVNTLDLVVLNAGILGDIKYMSQTSIEDLNKIMDINVWSNKVIFDWLLQSGIDVKQILLMSSGAAVLGNNGWSGYAMSKAALNMLAKLYAHEFPDTHITAIAPGLIQTKMMDYLCDDADNDKFPALKRLKAAQGTSTMLSPLEAGERILASLEPLKDFTSGSFIDLRQIHAPEEYKELMKTWSKGG